MNNIINQILDVYELKTKNLNLKLIPVNLAIEAKKSLDNFAYAISKKELNVDFRQKNSFALVDTNLINLVFENLIYNFIKYGNDFGHLLIDFEQDEQKVKVILEDDAKLSKELHYRKLFGFYQKPTPEQLNKFPTTEDSVIVKYIEAMDGKIKLVKSDNKGSKVILKFNKPVNQQTNNDAVE